MKSQTKLRVAVFSSDYLRKKLDILLLNIKSNSKADSPEDLARNGGNPKQIAIVMCHIPNENL